MNDEDIELIIEITYNDKKFSIEDINLIDLNELIKQSISHFNIENKFQKRIVFTYKDEDGDINIISNKDDIIKSSKGIGSKKYLSKLELNIVSDDKNNMNEKTYDENRETKNLEENEEIKKLEEMNNLKDNKINELEDKIIKLKKECQQLKDNSNISIPIKKVLIEENELENNKNQIINESIKNELKNIISDMFKTERENLENNFKKLKIDLISEINNNMKKDKQNNDDLNKIFDDISFIKENIEINIKENKDEQNKMNDFYTQFLNNNMARMKPAKFYKCQNCNFGFMSHDCFDIANNKSYDEHNFKCEKSLDNQNENNIQINKNEIINDNNNEENEIQENIEEKNDKEEEKNINNENIKKIEDKKNEEKEIKYKKKNEKKVENEEEEEKEEKKEKEEEKEEEENEDDVEEVLKFQNILQNYFLNENQELKKYYPNQDELDEIKNYYQTIYGKIDIKNYQESFIENINDLISNQTNKALLYKVNGRNGRIDQLRNLLKKFIDEKTFGKYKNNIKRFHNNHYYYKK